MIEPTGKTKKSTVYRFLGVRIECNGLTQALGAAGEGDTLVVWKLDRLERTDLRVSFLLPLNCN